MSSSYDKKLNVYRACYRTKMCNVYSRNKCKYRTCYYAHSKDELEKETCLDYYYTKECTKKDCDRIHSSRLPELPTELLDRFKYKEDGKLNELKRNLERAEDEADREYKKRKQNESRTEELQRLNKQLEEENTKLKQLVQQLHYANSVLSYQQQQQQYQQPPQFFNFPPPPPPSQTHGRDPRL